MEVKFDAVKNILLRSITWVSLPFSPEKISEKTLEISWGNKDE